MIILAVVLPAALLPLWLRALVILPIGMAIMEVILRRMTAFADANRKMAAESGKKLLWVQLAFIVAMVAFFFAGIVPDEELGWHKHVGLAIGVAMIVQVSYQLVLLRRPGR